MSAARAAAIALTLGVSALTLPAAADEAPSAGTPLNVRPSRPLELAPASSGSHVGTALTLLVAAVGAGVWAWKRRATTAPLIHRPSINVLARQSIGVRSELIVVEIDGQSLLLGVSSGSIQRLAVLPDAADTLREVEAEPEIRREAEAGANGRARPEPRREPASDRREPAPDRREPASDRRGPASGRREPTLEEQVRGLLRTGRRTS